MSGDIVRYPDGEAAGVAVLSWEPVRSDNPSVLKGHCSLHVPKWRLRLYGCAAFYSTTSGDSWVLPPSKAVIGRDGQVKKDAAGKAVFVPMLELDDRASTAAFSRAAVRALDIYTDGTWREGGS